MNLKIYRNSVLPISFISKYITHQHMLLDGSKIRLQLGCNSRVVVSIYVVLPGGLFDIMPFYFLVYVIFFISLYVGDRVVFSTR